jgi:hypothetical protein
MRGRVEVVNFFNAFLSIIFQNNSQRHFFFRNFILYLLRLFFAGIDAELNL